MSTGKTIAVFSDGTGNSSAKLHKTNVWRAYQALDLSDKPAQGLRQTAYYDDGVGTSTFRPLAILGGAFGWGLKRNVLDLYKFLCRNYEPGDRIYAFGFSRGAFTIRLLVGFVAQQRLLRGLSKEDLDEQAPQAYRLYRRRCSKGMGLARVVRESRSGGIVLPQLDHVPVRIPDEETHPGPKPDRPFGDLDAE